MACILHYPLYWHQCRVDAETAPRSLLSWLNKCMTGQSGKTGKMNLLTFTKLDDSGNRDQWHRNKLKTKVFQNRKVLRLRQTSVAVCFDFQKLVEKFLFRDIFSSRQMTWAMQTKSQAMLSMCKLSQIFSLSLHLYIRRQLQNNKHLKDFRYSAAR